MAKYVCKDVTLQAAGIFTALTVKGTARSYSKLPTTQLSVYRKRPLPSLTIPWYWIAERFLKQQLNPCSASSPDLTTVVTEVHTPSLPLVLSLSRAHQSGSSGLINPPAPVDKPFPRPCLCRSYRTPDLSTNGRSYITDERLYKQ